MSAAAPSLYSCQLQTCNLALITLGLTTLALTLTQFSRIALDNYRDIDIRLFSVLHIVTGSMGVYCIFKNHGSIVAKTMYTLSIIFAISSAIFYGLTTYRIVGAYHQLISLKNVQGFEQEYGRDLENQIGKITVSGVIVVISVLTAFVSMIAVLLLDKLVIVDDKPSWLSIEQDQELKYNINQLTTVAAAKLLLGFGTLALAVFLEYEHELISGRDNYIKIALDHIAAFLTIASAIQDFYAVFGKAQGILNLKVSIALSVVASVWALKSIDNGMLPYYANDIRYYRTVNNLNEPNLSNSEGPKYIVVIIHGVLLGLFPLLFLLNICTAILASCCVKQDALSYEQAQTKALALQSSFLGALHVIWAICCVILVFIGLADAPWNGDYIGGDMLWLAALFFATGVISTNNYHTLLSTRFVLNTVTFGLCIEKAIVSCNLVYQAACNPDYQQQGGDVFVGRLILQVCQLTVLVFETLTSVTGVIINGRALIRTSNLPTPMGSSHLQIILAFGFLTYGIVFSATYIIFEIGRWKFTEVPLEIPFYRLANGPLFFVVFVVQLITPIFPRLATPAIIIQIIAAANAFFVLASTSTNVFYLHILLKSDDILQNQSSQQTFLEVACILAVCCTIMCIVAMISGVMSALRFSYLIHHKSTNTVGSSNDSTTITPLEDSFNIAAASPFQFQPMEEQTVSWSSDDNPFYFQSSKRYYGQPYSVDYSNYGNYGMRRYIPHSEGASSEVERRPSTSYLRRSDY